MTALGDEEHVLTVYADVHYYFNEPSPRPLAHRFDKGSYLYLYGNRNGSGARLELANHVGEPEQDAVTGLLDACIIEQSYKHQTLCTVSINGYTKYHGSPSRLPEHFWKLPETDPRNTRNTLLHLHTLDIYFWTAQDANSFIDQVQRLLQQEQLVLLDRPATAVSQPERATSKVVQQLEDVAIQDPTYRQTQNQAQPATPTPRAIDDTASTDTGGASFAPLAYNPAAPAAPEPIAHREKTPPPVDDGAGTGLAAAVHADHTSPPPQTYTPHSGAVVPTRSLTDQSLTTFSPPPTQAAPTGETSETGVMPNQPHVALQHVQPQYPDYLASTGHEAPGPIGGYSNFSYTAQPQQQPAHQTGQNDYDVHSQLYRPTEEEAHHDGKKKKPASGQQAAPGRLEQGSNRIDKGVNRFLKRIEKKIG